VSGGELIDQDTSSIPKAYFNLPVSGAGRYDIPQTFHWSVTKQGMEDSLQYDNGEQSVGVRVHTLRTTCNAPSAFVEDEDIQQSIEIPFEGTRLSGDPGYEIYVGGSFCCYPPFPDPPGPAGVVRRSQNPFIESH